MQAGRVLFIAHREEILLQAKERLVVLDFIGNHKGFLNKPQALFGVGSNYRSLAEFGRRVRDDRLTLPAGYYVNYDLTIIDFHRKSTWE